MPVIDRRGQPLPPNHPLAQFRIVFGVKRLMPTAKTAPPSETKDERPAEPPPEK
jgi:hypothetical protein